MKLSGTEAAVLAATDQLLDRHTLDDAARFYQRICDFLNTFEVAVEEEPGGVGRQSGS
ncbi:hypothetical protein GCM10009837_39070 [Streptomyces durmitorensis]|uniref:Uncharacterized protein n=1 Tax=Streptomyces durmitorensis TaxID=319947 RepID=A0ABY4Q6K7_9ACTN|nr:hypothetical protein [Streptomyces durmitorensis]UQT61030.1 hypothetical protein M4V62_41480 [Streptomyces durmitorensis]